MGKGKGKSRKDLQGGGKAKLGAGTTICRFKGLEVQCHKDTISAYREGRIDLSKVLQMEVVFSSSKKNQQASESDLDQAFPGMSAVEVLEEIVSRGTYQQSTAERRALTEQRRARVVNHFVTHYVDPKSGYPHPATRIDAALSAAKVRIDIDLHMDKQLKVARKAVEGLLPLKPHGPRLAM
jgi:ribosome maturation protein SDO1